MAVISLADAARYTKGLPHQLDAWEWLQQALDEEVLAGFAERFRAAPPAAPKAMEMGCTTAERTLAAAGWWMKPTTTPLRPDGAGQSSWKPCWPDPRHSWQ
jgi:hypothetical protein